MASKWEYLQQKRLAKLQAEQSAGAQPTTGYPSFDPNIIPTVTNPPQGGGGTDWWGSQYYPTIPSEDAYAKIIRDWEAQYGQYRGMQMIHPAISAYLAGGGGQAIPGTPTPGTPTPGTPTPGTPTPGTPSGTSEFPLGQTLENLIRERLGQSNIDEDVWRMRSEQERREKTLKEQAMHEMALRGIEPGSSPETGRFQEIERGTTEAISGDIRQMVGEDRTRAMQEALSLLGLELQGQAVSWDQREWLLTMLIQMIQGG